MLHVLRMLCSSFFQTEAFTSKGRKESQKIQEANETYKVQEAENIIMPTRPHQEVTKAVSSYWKQGFLQWSCLLVMLGITSVATFLCGCPRCSNPFSGMAFEPAMFLCRTLINSLVHQARCGQTHLFGQFLLPCPM